MTDFDTSPIIIEDSAPPSVRGERLAGRYGMVSLVGASLRSEAGIRDAITKLTAWLDAPRLAARATAEVVAQEIVYGVRFCLLRTSHEWGVGDDSDPVVEWYTGPDAERLARTDYAESRGKALCICGAECDADEIDRSGDEPQCPKCVAEAVAAFKAQRFRCADVDPQGLPDACGWEGVGDDVLKFFEKQDVACPGCGGIVEEIAP